MRGMSSVGEPIGDDAYADASECCVEAAGDAACGWDEVGEDDWAAVASE